MQRSVLLLAVVLAAGCGSGGPPPVVIPLAPDFALLDVNPNSPSYDLPLSPRDRIGFVTGWYFGAAT